MANFTLGTCTAGGGAILLASSSALLFAILLLASFDHHRAHLLEREQRARDDDDVVRRLVDEVAGFREERRRAGGGRPSSSPPGRDENTRELQSPVVRPSGGGHTHASDFGVVGDAMADDGPALQAAIDSAASSSPDDLGGGGIVLLPAGTFRTSVPLVVPGGVSLAGMGYGSSPLALKFDAGGSVVAYCGPGYAVELIGHGSALRDMAVYNWRYGPGCIDVVASGGILVDANAKLIESVTLSNVLIYSFLGGTGLELRARNAGGIAYGNYQNFRIRHAKTGIRLAAEDEGSFVNTNLFLGGAISGGGFEYGILAEGPGACNDNKFYGTCVEPPDSVAHVYVTGSKTNVRLHDVRLEASTRSLDRPIVVVDDSSYGNVMDGVLGHTHVMANFHRNPGIDFASHKSVGLDPAPANVYWNAAFKGYSGPGGVMPGWSFVGSNANVTMLADTESLYPDHHVISVDYFNAAGGPFKLQADQTVRAPGHDYVTFGIHSRSSVPGSIVAAMRHSSGSIVSSAAHSGSGKWEFVGMTGLYDKANPTFYFSITGDVDLTAPTLTYGGSAATPGASLMSSSGARMSGTLSFGMSTILPPPPETPTHWKLPRNMGNVYVVDVLGNPTRTIARLNDSTFDRFPRGAVVTLLFSLAGTRMNHSAYIKLKNGTAFTSVVNSSITLVSDGVGTWTEVSRNV